MIVVDSSVWIAHFRNEVSPAVAMLRGLQQPDDIVTADVVLLECLQGARNERHAAQIEAILRSFVIEATFNDALAVEGARHYRRLRALAVTPRKMADLMIAAFCIQRDYTLLHQDRDFDPMVMHLGLRSAI